MNEEKRHKFTVTIADVEPFAFTITLAEEPIFRKAAYHVNNLWQKMQQDQPGKSSHYALAKVALAFAELYYRKSEQLASQSKMLEDFEHELDEILMGLE
ncbi:MAG: cell division protein ZapA [Muribaculaceae bacterium]|nr:cell division protein ZapA [Muribaculaceae bacterium]